jgi:hypothetical protein
MTQKDKEEQPKRAVNYWDELGNLAQILQEGGPIKKSGQYWADLLARIKAGCEKHNPNWKGKDGP